MDLNPIVLGYTIRENEIRNLKRTKEMENLNINNNALVKDFNYSATIPGLNNKLNNELSALINTIGIGRDNRSVEAIKNAKVGVARAKRASDILEYAERYESYEAVIKSMNDQQFDSYGLPKDPVRAFIASQKAILRNNISSELCSDSERTLFKARINNLDALEKEYKPIQKAHMEEFIKKNPEHPNTEIYLSKNKTKVKHNSTMER